MGGLLAACGSSRPDEPQRPVDGSDVRLFTSANGERTDLSAEGSESTPFVNLWHSYATILAARLAATSDSGAIYRLDIEPIRGSGVRIERAGDGGPFAHAFKVVYTHPVGEGDKGGSRNATPILTAYYETLDGISRELEVRSARDLETGVITAHPDFNRGVGYDQSLINLVEQHGFQIYDTATGEFREASGPEAIQAARELARKAQGNENAPPNEIRSVFHPVDSTQPRDADGNAYGTLAHVVMYGAHGDHTGSLVLRQPNETGYAALVNARTGALDDIAANAIRGTFDRNVYESLSR